MSLTPERITELRALITAATPGPWMHDTEGNTGCGTVYTAHEDLYGGDIAEPAGDLYPRGGYDPKADMAFIVAARTALPAALDEVERLHAWLSLLFRVYQTWWHEVATYDPGDELTQTGIGGLIRGDDLQTLEEACVAVEPHEAAIRQALGLAAESGA